MCQSQTAEPEGKPALALELAKQAAKFGPVLNLQVTWAAALALPWGLAAAGAAATKTLVDAGDVPGVHRPYFSLQSTSAISVLVSFSPSSLNFHVAY